MQKANSYSISFRDNYEGAAEQPTCTQRVPLPAGSYRDNSINGVGIYAALYDVWTVFDGPTPGAGVTRTHASGHGFNCGCANGPSHGDGIAGFEYCFHCAWS